MNLNSREIRLVSNRRCHMRCCCCCLNCLFLLRRRESVCTFNHQSSCSVFVFGRLFALHSFGYSFLCLSFSFYCLCSGHLSPILTSIKVSKCIKTKRETSSCSCTSVTYKRKHPHSVAGFPLL